MYRFLSYVALLLNYYNCISAVYNRHGFRFQSFENMRISRFMFQYIQISSMGQVEVGGRSQSSYVLSQDKGDNAACFRQRGIRKSPRTSTNVPLLLSASHYLPSMTCPPSSASLIVFIDHRL